MKNKIIFSLLLLLTNLFVFAQNKNVEMADIFRRDGKIYVVVAVILTIFAGLVIYLIRLDRKLTKLEKEIGSL